MMDVAPVHLSVVIPAFEEARRLGPTLNQVRAYLDDQPYVSEVVVVIDGGRDGTLGLVRDLATEWPALTVHHSEVNRGKGHAVRLGMLASRGWYLLFSDADLSTPIAEVERLIAALEAGGDVAIGSRALADSDVRVRQAWWRQSMGRAFNRFVRLSPCPGFATPSVGSSVSGEMRRVASSLASACRGFRSMSSCCGSPGSSAIAWWKCR